MKSLLIFIISFTSIVFCESIVKRELDKSYAFYESVENDLSIKNLVILDSMLKKFISNLRDYEKIDRENGIMVDYPQEYWDDKYKKIGIEHAYCATIGYNNQFLARAHKIDPQSEYRKYTFYSTILGIADPSGLGVMPKIKNAYLYLKEFPDGPYIDEVYLILARFHTDLFMVVRDLNNSGKSNLGYIYDCYKPYVEKRSYDEQLKDNQRIALKFLKKYIELHPDRKIEYPRNWLEDLENGTINSWSYCAD